MMNDCKFIDIEHRYLSALSQRLHHEQELYELQVQYLAEEQKSKQILYRIKHASKYSNKELANRIQALESKLQNVISTQIQTMKERKPELCLKEAETLFKEAAFLPNYELFLILDHLISTIDRISMLVDKIDTEKIYGNGYVRGGVTPSFMDQHKIYLYYDEIKAENENFKKEFSYVLMTPGLTNPFSKEFLEEVRDFQFKTNEPDLFLYALKKFSNQIWQVKNQLKDQLGMMIHLLLQSDFLKLTNSEEDIV